MSDTLEKPESGAPEQSSGDSRRPKKSKSGALLTFVLVIVLALVALYALDRFAGFNIITSEEDQQREEVEDFLAETGAWHAVFLTNGQVYFGQLSNADAQFARLRDIYYLQLQQVQTPPPVTEGGEEGAQVVDAPSPQPPQLSLIKLGTELHRPKDIMNINRDHILFWEELEADSNVVQAIAQYKEAQ